MQLLKALFNLYLLLLLAAPAFGQLTFRVVSIPANTPPGGHIFLAGNFNGWQPGDDAYILERQDGEVYEATLSIPPGMLEFKFTRGSWETVEGDATGGYLPNRTYQYAGGPDTLYLEILSWEGREPEPSSGYFVLSEDFFMPQLNRSRRIWLYLPPDYDSSGRDYPVLYMQDGQNVFDAATAFNNREWAVDEALNRLFDEGDEGVIVVAIDNGGAARLGEYTPWPNPDYPGSGNGVAYAEFIVETLKPYIDDNYRTKPEREFTGIMGSSLGGLISFYIGMEYQEVFSKVGALSTSFWFTDDVYTHVADRGKQADMRIYMIAGELEGTGGAQVADMNAMYNTLRSAGFSAEEIVALSHADGQHSEWYWSREFPTAYQWLYRADMAGLDKKNWEKPLFRPFPNPSDTNFQLFTTASYAALEYEIFSAGGSLIQKRKPYNGESIPAENLTPGLYFLRAYSEGKLIGVARLVRR